MVKPKLRKLITEKNSWLLALNAYLLISNFFVIVPASVLRLTTYKPEGRFSSEIICGAFA